MYVSCPCLQPHREGMSYIALLHLHAGFAFLCCVSLVARQCGIYNDKTAQIQELTFEIRKVDSGVWV